MGIVVAAYGMGTNSTALLVGMAERGERVDLILSADTGGEKPYTYEYLALFQEWLEAHDFPAIQVVRYERETLEENCHRMHMLPSIAYGYKTCSQKFKIEPQDKFCNNWQPAKDAWARGEKVIKLIGYDMDEPQRAKIREDKKYDYRYPLIEWGWGRDECIDAIERAGLPLPGKSACFFCPSSKKREILELADAYPDLAARAVAMEKNANLTSVKGLGRDWAWGDLLAFDARQIKLFPETPVQTDCGCYDEAEA